MATRKRNEWLEAENSDDDDAGHDSEALEESKGRTLTGRSTKRRKLSSDSEDEADDGSAMDGEDIAKPTSKPIATDTRFSTSKFDDEELEADPTDDAFEANALAVQDVQQQDHPAHTKPKDRLPKLPKDLTPLHLHISNEAAKRAGVIYLSRIPPFMKPSTLRRLLAPHAPSGLNRIFLTPEPATAYAARKRAGGNKKRSFVDGWVEFLSRKEARRAVELLNAQIVGGKKGGYYHDDVWSMKYLRRFTWADLVESISVENAERQARMRTEIAQSNKANKEFVENVERSKMLEGMERQRREKEAGAGVDSSKASTRNKGKEFHMEFRQNAVKNKNVKSKSQGEQPDQVKRVLSKIF